MGVHWHISTSQAVFPHEKGCEDYWTVRNIINSFQQEEAISLGCSREMMSQLSCSYTASESKTKFSLNFFLKIKWQRLEPIQQLVGECTYKNTTIIMTASQSESWWSKHLGIILPLPKQKGEDRKKMREKRPCSCISNAHDNSDFGVWLTWVLMTLPFICCLALKVKSMNFRFFICQMRIIILSTYQGWAERKQK